MRCASFESALGINNRAELAVAAAERLRPFSPRPLLFPRMQRAKERVVFQPVRVLMGERQEARHEPRVEPLLRAHHGEVADQARAQRDLREVPELQLLCNDDARHDRETEAGGDQALDRLGAAELDHAVARDAEELGRVERHTRQKDKQPVAQPLALFHLLDVGQILEEERGTNQVLLIVANDRERVANDPGGGLQPQLGAVWQRGKLERTAQHADEVRIGGEHVGIRLSEVVEVVEVVQVPRGGHRVRGLVVVGEALVRDLEAPLRQERQEGLVVEAVLLLQHVGPAEAVRDDVDDVAGRGGTRRHVGGVAVDRGRDDDARRSLGKLYATFTEGLDRPDLVNARRLLDEISRRYPRLSGGAAGKSAQFRQLVMNMVTPEEMQSASVDRTFLLRLEPTEALARMGQALDSFILEGVTTSIPFLARLIRHPDFVAGRVDTRFLERESQLLQPDA